MKDNVLKIVFLVKIKIMRNGSPSTLEMKTLFHPQTNLLLVFLSWEKIGIQSLIHHKVKPKLLDD